ncbi:MAG TPA: hypothetical protein VM753_23075 [Anaeromyxobacter sp.]|nr:hypothetical protein [Anaeromyxobacter sp.]
MGSDVVRRWAEGALELELRVTPEELRLVWTGKSADREPGRFILPVLLDVIDRAKEAQKPLVLDFKDLEYMNSSTFTPIVKSLAESRKAAVAVVLEYALHRKWQALSFSALRTFETLDGRVQVQGK